MQRFRDSEQQHLWDAYARERTPQNESALVAAYYPLVQYLAQRLASTMPASVEVDDLVSMGTFGLIEAISRFDPSRGFQFKTYCSSRIRGAMLDRLRADDWVPRLVRQRAALVDKAQRQLRSELCREPTTPETATAIGVSVANFDSMVREASSTAVHSLDYERSVDCEGAGISLLGWLTDTKAVDPGAEQQRLDVRGVMFEHLDERERTILQQYYYEDLSMREIAVRLGLSESRVCQIHTQVIAAMRQRHLLNREALFA